MSILTRRQIILKNATKDDLHAFGGQVAYAEHPGSRGNRQQFYSERCSLTTDKFLTLDDVSELARQTSGGDEPPAIVKQLCTDAGGLFVQLPNVDGGAGPVAEGLARLASEFGQAASAMGLALADRVIDREEATKCHKELQDMITEGLALQAQLKQIVEGES